jgi:hypothetical protein
VSRLTPSRDASSSGLTYSSTFDVLLFISVLALHCNAAPKSRTDRFRHPCRFLVAVKGARQDLCKFLSVPENKGDSLGESPLLRKRSQIGAWKNEGERIGTGVNSRAHTPYPPSPSHGARCPLVCR